MRRRTPPHHAHEPVSASAAGNVPGGATNQQAPSEDQTQRTDAPRLRWRPSHNYPRRQYCCTARGVWSLEYDWVDGGKVVWILALSAPESAEPPRLVRRFTSRVAAIRFVMEMEMEMGPATSDQGPDGTRRKTEESGE